MVLLSKDFKLILGGKVGKRRAIFYALNALITMLFAAVEAFAVYGILLKLKSVDGKAPLAFVTISLFAVSVIMTVVCLVRAKRLFFNEKDRRALCMLPVTSTQVVLSKLVLLFIMQYVMGLIFTYPITLVYGIIFRKGRSLMYLGLFYPLLAFPFECGAALIFMYPYKLVCDFLKRHKTTQLIFAVIFTYVICFALGALLRLIVSLVSDGSFNMSVMVDLSRNLVPICWLVQVFFEGIFRSLIIYICIAVGVLILGVTLATISFNHLRDERINNAGTKKAPKLKTCSPSRALIKKELVLLFKNSDNLLPIGLLFAQPFLLYIIVSSINKICAAEVLPWIQPSFLPIIDILVVILVGLMVAQRLYCVILSENKSLSLIKTLPIGSLRQLLMKPILPLTFILLSELVTFVVLLIFGCVDVFGALFGFLIAALVEGTFAMISLYEQLRVRRNMPRSHFLSAVISFILPIVYAAATIVGLHFGLNIYVAYVIGVAAVLISGIPFVIKFKTRTVELFDRLEVMG